MNRNFLAFDLGAESGRAVAGTLNAGRLSLKEMHRFANPTGRMNGHLHWNLLAQWEELKTGLRKAAASGMKIDGIGVDTWGVDFGLVGHGGEILGYPYHYRDTRTDGMLDAVFKTVPREQVFADTGVQFMQLNSLYQLFAMSAGQLTDSRRRRDFAVHARPLQLPVYRHPQERVFDRDDEPVLRSARAQLGDRAA